MDGDVGVAGAVAVVERDIADEGIGHVADAVEGYVVAVAVALVVEVVNDGEMLRGRLGRKQNLVYGLPRLKLPTTFTRQQ